MSNTIPPDVRSRYLEAFKRFYDDDRDDVASEEVDVRAKILSAATYELATHAPADALNCVYHHRQKLIYGGEDWQPNDLHPRLPFKPSRRLRATQAAWLIVGGGVAYALISISLWLTVLAALVLFVAYVWADGLQRQASRDFNVWGPGRAHWLWRPTQDVAQYLGLEPRHITPNLARMLYNRHYREHPELYQRKATRPATRSAATTEWAPATAATWAVADTATSRDCWEDDDPLALPNELMHPQVNLNGIPMLNEGVDVMGNPWGTTSI